MNTETEQKFEYEFSFRYQGRPSFVTLWDTNDQSACERAMCQKIDADEIVISKETGNGFIKDVTGAAWTFHKEPYRPSYELSTDIRAGVEADLSEQPVKRRAPKTPDASDILAGL
jgi:hypothetical protein